MTKRWRSDIIRKHSQERGQASEEEKLKKLQEKHLTNEELYDRMIKLLKRNRMRISRKTENSDERNQKVLKKVLDKLQNL